MKKVDMRLLLPFNGLHRFIPVLFNHAGLRIVEVPVNHRPRKGGKTKYGNLERALRGFYDLIGVRWLLARRIAWPKESDPPRK
jgi:dolichol-phosphate mannosyltransferase